MSFGKATKRLTIASIDDDTTVTAQFNPKELQIDQNVPWKKPEAATKTGSQAQSGASSKGNPLELEFTGAEARTMTLELLFDEYEQLDTERTTKVADAVRDLTKMATVIKADSKKETERRPHHCVVKWGTALDKFRCVIESLSVKYTMFSTNGDPLRATCTVKLKEAEMKAEK